MTKYLYWSSTAIIVFCWITGGVADLIRQPDTLAGMVALGYPPYILTILGSWKILGAIAILVPRFPRLKEWAYAGTFFELSGAVASHAFAGSTLNHLIWPGFFTVCTLVSWALRPPTRIAFPTKLDYSGGSSSRVASSPIALSSSRTMR